MRSKCLPCRCLLSLSLPPPLSTSLLTTTSLSPSSSFPSSLPFSTSILSPLSLSICVRAARAKAPCRCLPDVYDFDFCAYVYLHIYVWFCVRMSVTLRRGWGDLFLCVSPAPLRWAQLQVRCFLYDWRLFSFVLHCLYICVTVSTCACACLGSYLTWVYVPTDSCPLLSRKDHFRYKVMEALKKKKKKGENSSK